MTCSLQISPNLKCQSSASARRIISGLMVHRMPFIVTELGADVDPFMLHICCLGGKEPAMISQRTEEALASGGEGGRQGLHPPRSLLKKAAAKARAEELRPVLTELAGDVVRKP